MEQTKYVFRYRNLDPAKLRPNGDRYLIEILAVDEEKLGSGLFLPELTEECKGWAAGVVFSIGNGHRLENPDSVVVIPEGYRADPSLNDEDQMRRRISALGYRTPAMGDSSTVMRVDASVPMFMTPGEVVFIERYSGRQFTIGGREFRFVNQVDVLGSSGVFLKLTPDGEWEERDLVAEQNAAEEQAEGQAREELRARAGNGKRIIRP